MNKTAEEMAEEYAKDWHKDCDYPEAILKHTKKATETVFLAGYKAAQDQSPDVTKQISVKQWLPQESTHCVIRIDDGEYQVAWRENGHWIMFNPCCIYNSQLNNVTHWMELPAPPKEEK